MNEPVQVDLNAVIDVLRRRLDDMTYENAVLSVAYRTLKDGNGEPDRPPMDV